MSDKRETPVSDARTEATLLLAEVLREVCGTLDRLELKVIQQAQRLGRLEQKVYSLSQALATAADRPARRTSTTDRALGELLASSDAVLIELEPNGQAKATAFRGPFKIESDGSYQGAWVAEARAGQGERAGAALENLAGYVYHSRRDQFASAPAGVAGDRQVYNAPPAADQVPELPF